MRTVSHTPAAAAASELAAYFRTALYKRRVEYQLSRQSSYAIVHYFTDFGLAQYWRDEGYGHAADLAARLDTPA